MASTDLEIAQTRLDAYYAAEARILSAGQEGSFSSRRRRDADLIEVRHAIAELKAEIAALQTTGSRFITVVPR